MHLIICINFLRKGENLTSEVASLLYGSCVPLDIGELIYITWPGFGQHQTYATVCFELILSLHKAILYVPGRPRIVGI